MDDSLKSVKDWKIKDIESLIENKIQENTHLEYKRSYSLENTDQNKNEISRDISAFANLDGRTIIYGVEEKKQILTSIDQGIVDKGKREWLEQVINSRITHKIPKILIKPIPLDDQTQKTIFVVTVPIGITAYQAHDKKYYKRNNF